MSATRAVILGTGLTQLLEHQKGITRGEEPQGAPHAARFGTARYRQPCARCFLPPACSLTRELCGRERSPLAPTELLLTKPFAVSLSFHPSAQPPSHPHCRQPPAGLPPPVPPAGEGSVCALPACSCALPAFPRHPNAIPMSGALHGRGLLCSGSLVPCGNFPALPGNLTRSFSSHCSSVYLPGNIFRRLTYL